MAENQEVWVLALRTAGVFHFVTLILACFTPIPPNWEENLAKLPDVHRRFATAQNVFIGLVIAGCGLTSLLLAEQLVQGTVLARTICAGIGLWWGGRLFVLPWLRAHRYLSNPMLKLGYVLLLCECALYLAGYGYLALR
jgi:hypothetical protein